MVVGDVLRLRQVLTNLVGNAVKFTEQGHVTVSVETHTEDETRNQIHFVVEDTGIGISPDQIERLFNEYTQADTSTARHYGGTDSALAYRSGWSR